MAGIPVAFGAFAGGLWGGATSMMSLALGFQQYQQNEMALNELRQGIAARDRAQQQAAQAGPAGTDQQLPPDQQQQPPAQPAQPAPAQPTPAVTPAGTNVPTPGGKGSDVHPPQAAPARVPATPVDRRDATAAPAATAAPTTFATPTDQTTQQQQQQQNLNELGIPTQTPAAPAPPVVGRLPMVAPAPAGQTSQDQQQQQNLQELGIPANRTQYPFSGTTFGAQGVPGAAGGPGGPAQTPAQRNPPLLAYPAPRIAPAAPAQPAPAAPATPTPAGTPGLTVAPQVVGSAQPPSQGGGVLGAIGRAIMPSAAAAEPQPGPGLTTTPPPVAPAATSESAGQTAARQPAPAATQPAGKPATAAAVLPAATPDYTATLPASQRPPPAPTPRVAPDQKGPTVTEQPPAQTPAVLQVDPRPWHTIQLYYPELARQIQYAADKYGGGQVTAEQLAYVKIRESGWEMDPRNIPDGDGGTSLGAMQVKAGTFAGATNGHPATGDFDPHTMQGSLDQAAAVFNYLGLKFGQGSVQMHYAYMRGEGAAIYAAAHGIEAADQRYPGGLDLLRKMYPTGNFTGTSYFPGQWGNGADQRTIMTNLTQGAAAGPDGALKWLAAYTPKGLGLDNAWRAAQSHFEMYAMIKGNYSALPMIQNYFAGLSHAGALSSLASGYSALVAGDTKTAAQFFAKAYAFFPDGVEGRLAVDQKGQLWAQRFDGGTQQPLGAPFQLTPDVVAAKMTELGTDPRNFLSTFQNYLKEAAQIRETNSHANYFEAMPQVREEMNQLRAQHQAEMEQLAREKQAAEEETRAAKSDQTNQRVGAIDTDVGKRYGSGNQEGTLTRPDGVDDRQWATQSEIARRLQYPEASGGANLGAPMADTLAGDIRSGHAQFQGFMGKDNLGRPVPSFAIWGQGKDPTKDQPDAEVSFETGRRFMAMAPGNRATGTGVGAGQGGQGGNQPGLPVNPPPNPAQRASVGAGAGSPMVAMGGGFNLAGPVMNQPQQQPQPNAVS